jgi:hypothetical protein
MGKAITKTKLLLVEGNDEVELFDKLLADLGLVDVEIRNIMGKTKFRKNIKGLPKLTGFGKVASVGIVTDADKQPQRTFDGICDALGAAGLPRPTVLCNRLVMIPRLQL